MSRIRPLDVADLSVDQKAQIEAVESLLGFVANDALIMSKSPALSNAVAALVAVIYAPGEVDSGLKRLVGMLTSVSAGCQYCVAHTAFTSEMHGIGEEKLAEVWNFESSTLFTSAEKTVLRVAFHSGQSPNGVTDEMFVDMAKHYSEAAQLEIVAVIAMFGFLNRWNSTLATDLESLPSESLRKLGESPLEAAP